MQLDDILIVAPYNAQVSDLMTRMPGARIGTVDKFQGQQAPVVIYSLTTSSPEDAPRGMEFLYSLNRLNVATSRAQSDGHYCRKPPFAGTRMSQPTDKCSLQMRSVATLNWLRLRVLNFYSSSAEHDDRA